MKAFKTILNFVVITVLSILLIVYTVLNIFSKTLLSKDFILAKMEENNYYEKLVEYVNSSFENYIYQSGLDEEVIKNIVTEEKIKSDTNAIIDNVYEGKEFSVDTQSIKDKLLSNISDSINGRSFSATEQKAVDVFANNICSAYEDTLLHTNYVQKVHSVYSQITEYKDLANKIILGSSVVCVILLMLINIKEKAKILSTLAIAVLVAGAFLILLNVYIKAKININSIVIFSDAISEIVVKIISNILEQIMNNGIIYAIIGFAGIIISSIFSSKNIEEKN